MSARKLLDVWDKGKILSVIIGYEYFFTKSYF